MEEGRSRRSNKRQGWSRGEKRLRVGVEASGPTQFLYPLSFSSPCLGFSIQAPFKISPVAVQPSVFFERKKHLPIF